MYIIYSLYYYTVCGKDTAVVVLVSCGEFLDFCGKSAPKLAYLYTIFICFFVDKPTLFWSILKKQLSVMLPFCSHTIGSTIPRGMHGCSFCKFFFSWLVSGFLCGSCYMKSRAARDSHFSAFIFLYFNGWECNMAGYFTSCR